MADTSFELKRLSAGACSDDGRRVRFRIETAENGPLDIACGCDDLEPIIQFMIQLGAAAADSRSGVTPHTMGNTDRIAVSPIGISDLGFVEDRDSGETALVMRMFGFDLGFSLSPAQIDGLHREFERIRPGSARAHGHHHDHHH